jgi:hypothetical protein
MGLRKRLISSEKCIVLKVKRKDRQREPFTGNPEGSELENTWLSFFKPAPLKN